MMTTATQRHSLTTRLTHWGTTAAFALLFSSGAALYNHRPRFRVGSHSLTLPRIPSWLALGSSPKIVHYVFAALFILCAVAYFAWGIRSGHFKELLVHRSDLPKLLPMQLYYLGLRKEPPPYGRYNPLQKLAYSTVLFVVAPLIVLSGVAMLPVHALHAIGVLFLGGVKLWHFSLMWVLVSFLVVHLTMVLTTGFVKNLRAMTVGESTGSPYPTIRPLDVPTDLWV